MRLSQIAQGTAMPKRRIAVIACGVLQWDIERLRARLRGIEPVVRVLPGQLHNDPHQLRELLQAQIDELDADESLRGIALAYGLCGRGTIRLQARRLPLVLPRAQDCIGILLGSHGRHMEQFGRHPGTRYLSQGWYDSNHSKRATERYHTARNDSLYGPSYQDLEQRYGPDNARFIAEFRESWKRNYRRSAYIRFEGESDCGPAPEASRALACELGWEHEILAGDDTLLFAMLNGDWSDPRLLVIPPGHKTASAPGEAVFGFTLGVDSHIEEVLARFASSGQQEAPTRSGIGLGIDTGGTYTDAVIYDFAGGKVLAQAKAPTVHEDLVVGIRAALAALPGEPLRQVSRVGLSTTLATNAFVESKGRPVGLLLLSGFEVDLERLPFRFVRHLRGIMTIDGSETEAVDEAQVRLCAREAKAAGCEAIAISGFASVINPAHEQTVARIAFEETGLHAVCGHELTSELNFLERANTAGMNARLVPLIEALIDAVTAALADHGLCAVRIMLVKGDGSQLLADVARQVPVETVLSGPAASVVGAARIFAATDAVVADMGGTTLDVAMLRHGLPELSDTGARIGEFRTSVRAMAVQTIGLGGDSEIDLSEWPAVRIGPRRVIPVCRLAETQPRCAAQLPELLREVVSRVRNATDLVALAPGASPGEDRVLRQVAEGPVLLAALAYRLNRPSPDYLPWHALESRGLLRRYGFTLTDVLHLQGTFTAFDGYLSGRVLDHWCVLLEVTREEIIDRILHEFRRMVIDTVLQVALPPGSPWTADSGLRRWLTARMADREPGRDASICPRLRVPLVGVGAPVGALFPELAAHLDTRVIVGDLSPVANAVGAIAGDVMLREVAAVRVRDDGVFVCSWRGGSARAADLGQALDSCTQALTAILRSQAEANRIPFAEPAFSLVRHEANTRDGSLFLGVTLRGELRG
jgi:N-methylhydantoinase A/oxoprolinase/acetone carboxylase beta subunit